MHRFVFDTTTAEGFDAALLYATNYFTANQSGYGLGDADLAVVIVARHNSTPFAYTDSMWAKYGAPLSERRGVTDPSTKPAPTVNVYRSRVDALVKRGAHLAVCQMATRRLAGTIATATGSSADRVYDELAAQSGGKRAPGARRRCRTESRTRARLLLRVRCLDQCLRWAIIADMAQSESVLVGSANETLGRAVCDELGIAPIQRTIHRFPDGEIQIEILESVRGRDVFLLQATSFLRPINMRLSCC